MGVMQGSRAEQVRPCSTRNVKRNHPLLYCDSPLRVQLGEVPSTTAVSHAGGASPATEEHLSLLTCATVPVYLEHCPFTHY